jgi:Zn ribbon nucleic-acid-binding protein
MPTRSKFAKTAGTKCPICEGQMELKTVIPAAHIYPELHTFQCIACGHLRTVEDDSELSRPPWVKFAA